MREVKEREKTECKGEERIDECEVEEGKGKVKGKGESIS